MKNKPLSAYKKKKLIETFCDELTATQAAHRLNLDRNTVNKYFKRIRECIAGYREYQKMKLMIHVMASPLPQLQTISRHLNASNAEENGIPIRIMCIDGQLLTEMDIPGQTNGSRYMMNVSQYFNGHSVALMSNDPVTTIDCGDLNSIAEDFYHFTTLRFKKFFGIKNDYAYLYVKEAEFVFNEKDYQQRERLLLQMTDSIFA